MVNTTNSTYAYMIEVLHERRVELLRELNELDKGSVEGYARSNQIDVEIVQNREAIHLLRKQM